MTEKRIVSSHLHGRRKKTEKSGDWGGGGEPYYSAARPMSNAFCTLGLPFGSTP